MYVVHCIFAGFAYMLMHVLNVAVGMTFSGGLIDLFCLESCREIRRPAGSGLW